MSKFHQQIGKSELGSSFASVSHATNIVLGGGDITTCECICTCQYILIWRQKIVLKMKASYCLHQLSQSTFVTIIGYTLLWLFNENAILLYQAMSLLCYNVQATYWTSASKNWTLEWNVITLHNSK